MLVGTWAAADWAIRFYERHGFELVSPERTTTLLQRLLDDPRAPDRDVGRAHRASCRLRSAPGACRALSGRADPPIHLRPPRVAPGLARHLRVDHRARAGRGAGDGLKGGRLGHRDAAGDGSGRGSRRALQRGRWARGDGAKEGHPGRAPGSGGGTSRPSCSASPFPAVFFILAAVGVLGEETAFDVAEWAGIGLIGMYGFAGARLSGNSRFGSLLRASGVALIGTGTDRAESARALRFRVARWQQGRSWVYRRWTGTQRLVFTWMASGRRSRRKGFRE